MPEICFVGRSNVGKSSLLNSLTGTKAARTSSTPGMTRRINLYQVTYELKGKKHPLLCSDFPGYGYAKVSRKEHAQWQQMIESYILTNPHIKSVLWLRDVRREFDALDGMFLEWARINNLPVSLVLTKADKATQAEIAKAKTDLRRIHGLEDVLVFSSKNSVGKPSLVSRIIESIEREVGGV